MLLIALLAALATAQQKADKDKDKETGAGAKKVSKAPNSYIHLGGKVRCGKPAESHTIEVPDRPGHALTIEKRTCTWVEPLVLAGAKSKDGTKVEFAERMEGALHQHGFQVDTLDNGEKLTMQTMGQVPAEKGPAESKGRWSLMRGTGKYKGIKGGGTYTGKLEADDVLTLDFEGIYDPADMVGEKK